MKSIFVPGVPVPKQSYRSLKKGGGYIPARVKAWQDTILMTCRPHLLEEPTAEPVKVKLEFYLPTHRRVDLDNLSKAVLDALNKFAWRDDSQVIDLHIVKTFCEGCFQPGVRVTIF